MMIVTRLIYDSQGRYADAEPLYARALQPGRIPLKPPAIDSAVSYSVLSLRREHSPMIRRLLGQVRMADDPAIMPTVRAHGRTVGQPLVDDAGERAVFGQSVRRRNLANR